MSLRLRLTLAFAALALIPIGTVVPFALSELDRTLAREQSARLDAALDVTRAELDERCRAVRRAVTELAASTALEDWARRSARESNGEERRELARRLMEARGLTVLTLLDAEGRTLSSGQLPARRGDLDSALLATSSAARGRCAVARLDAASAQGLLSVPALLSSQGFEYGALRLHIVGGLRLDRDLPEQLARLTGARVELWQDGASIARGGSVSADGPVHRLAAGAGAEWVLTFDAGVRAAAQRGVAVAFAILAGVGLLLSFLIGAAFSRRLTRPVEALTSGARAVAGGDLDARIPPGGPGEVGELVAAFNTMTERLRRATEQRLAAERVAAWQDIAKALAHELKNPLTPIQMSLETLAAAAKANSPRVLQLLAESTPAMLEEVGRLRRTVDAFSHFARLPRPTRVPLELAGWVTQTLGVHGAVASGVELRTELPPELWVEADRDQLTQVLVNLLKNAQEALAGRGGRIELRVRRAGAEAQLEIEDSGPGVTADARGQLFTPYFTTKQGGSGLGLAIAARIAHEHGGRLELDPRPGPGALFRLALPLADVDAGVSRGRASP